MLSDPTFDEWLSGLDPAPDLEPKAPSDFIQPILLQRQDRREEAPTLAFIVGPLRTPPAPTASSCLNLWSPAVRNEDCERYSHLPMGSFSHEPENQKNAHRRDN